MTPHISTTLLRTQSDERLVRLAAGGHERAFEAIVERYSKPLTRFAQRFVGQARAEEVVQTAFLNAWNSLNAGTEVRDLKPWLYRIVNNGAINAMQRADYSDAPLIEANDFRLGPEAAYEQSEELRLTVEGIGELPERQREALLAVAVDGRAHAEVARDLGVSDAGVRQLVRRARVQLRAAATAITPLPLAVWIAKGGLAGGTAAGGAAAGTAAAGTTAGGTAVGGAALTGAVKAGALVVGAAVVATGGTEVARKVEKDSSSGTAARIAAAGPRERMLIPGVDPALAATGDGQARLRVVVAPDGSRRMVAETAPGMTPPHDGHGGYMPVSTQPAPGQPRQVAGVFDPTMPASPGTGGGHGNGDGSGRGPQQVAQVPGKGGGTPTPAGSGGGGGSGSGSKEDGSGSRGSSSPENPGSGGSEKPSGGSEKPSGGSEKPSTTPSKPSGGSEKPSGGSEKPSTTPSKPSGGSEKPSGGSEKPSGGSDKPSTTPSKPSGGGNSGKGNQSPANDEGSGSSPGNSGGKGNSGGRGKSSDD